MAILGEAHIIVRAITDGVGDDIKRAFNDSGVNDNINKNTKAMRGNADEALALAKAFHSLNRTGMTMQGGLGAVLGAVQALVSGGIIPLIGTLGQAATSGVALVSVFAAVKVGSLVAKSAFSGINQAVSQASSGNMAYKKTLQQVREEMQQLAFDAEDAALGEKRAALNLEKAREELMRVQDLPPNDRARREAELSYEEADLAFRRAKDRNSDLQKQIANPPKQRGAQDPFRNLTKSQKVFAQYLVGVKKTMKELHEAAASGFLPVLRKQIDRIIKGPAWGTLLQGYNTVGVALGKAAKNFTDSLTKGKNLANMKAFFVETSLILPKLGKVLGSVFGTFLSVLKAAAPLTNVFVGWLTKAANHLDRVVSVKANSGQLAGFFSRAGAMAGQFIRIFKNWGAGFGAVFGSAVGPGSGGQKLLDWLERASKRFKDARTSFSGRLLNEKNISQSTDNFIAMSSALGTIAHAFKGLGETGATAAFTEIARSAPYIHEILINAVRTGKAFGRVAAAVVKLFSAFSDAGQASAFLDTIANTLNFIANILKTIQPALNIAGQIFGVISALALLAGWGGKVMLLFKGFFLQMVAGGLKMRVLKEETLLNSAAMQKLGVDAEFTGKAMKTAFSTNLIMLGIMALVEAFSWLQQGVDDANNKIKDAAKGAFDAGASGTAALKAAFSSVDFSNQTASIVDYVDASNIAHERTIDVSHGMKDLRMVLYALNHEYSNYNHLGAYTNALDQFGQTLADMAGTDIEKAQAAFKDITRSQHLNKEQMGQLLSTMPKYREALVTQAAALGVNIKNTDGTVNGVKQLEFAMGEGQIATMRAAAAAEEFQRKIAGAAAEVINMGDAVQKATDKNGKVSVTKLIENLKAQAQDAANYYKNLLIIQGKGVGQPVIDAIIGMGAKEGSAAAAALASAGPHQLAVLKAQYAQVGSLTSDEMASRLTEAQPAVQEVFKKLGEAGMTSFIDNIMTTKDLNAARTKFLALLNANKEGNKYSFDTSGVLHGVDKSGKTLPGFFRGGLVSPLHLASGNTNPLRGFGGPQSDSIAAYLSPGEFVVNSSAVSRFLPVLQAMNQTSVANNRLNSTVPSAQAVSTPGGSVQIIVNPAPGMNETELAKRVAIEMGRQMRQGAF